MGSVLRLDVKDYVGPARWRWVLTDASGGIIADHDVRADEQSWQRGQRAVDQTNQHGHPSSQVTPNGRVSGVLQGASWACTSYRTANAHPAVLAAVGQVIPGNDEDGVATLIEWLFLDPC